MQPMLKIEGYDVRKRIRAKQQAFFLQLFLVHSELNLHTVLRPGTTASNNLREKKSNFSPPLYPSIKIKIVNETHIETQSQWQI